MFVILQSPYVALRIALLSIVQLIESHARPQSAAFALQVFYLANWKKCTSRTENAKQRERERERQVHFYPSVRDFHRFYLIIRWTITQTDSTR